MTINSYFNLYTGNQNEQDLLKDLTAESIQMYGMDIYYLPRDMEHDVLYSIERLSVASDIFYILGNHTKTFFEDRNFDVQNSTNNDGSYTVKKSNYLQDTDETEIYVNENVEDVADGEISISVEEDYLYGEAPASVFKNSYEIEMYLSNPEGFEGEGDVLSKLGLQVNDEMDLAVSTKRFPEVTGMTRPYEGDLIYLPLSGGLFVVNYVEHEKQFYPNGTLPYYNVRCELYSYSSEEFDTGISPIDNINSPPMEDDADSFNNEIQREGDELIDFDENQPFGNY